jgi:Mycothiol maleylpyruvate isomerase N-terminal domain
MSVSGLTGWSVLDEARARLRTAVAGVPADGWGEATPCSAWNAVQVLRHAALDQEVWGAALGGTPMPGENPFEPSGQLGGMIPSAGWTGGGGRSAKKCTLVDSGERSSS